MEEIEKKQMVMFDAFEKLEKSFKNYRKSPKERITIGYLEARLDDLETNWQNVKKNNEAMVTSLTKEEQKLLPYFADNIYEKYEEYYFMYKGEMKTALQKLLPTPSPSTSAEVPTQLPPGNVHHVSRNNNEVKLPRIALPVYSGDYTQWASFRDLFIALIHNNNSLENVQKMHYLKSSLSGEAEVLLRQFSVTGESYTDAWSILKRRYDHKRYIANSIFKKFFAQKPIVQETSNNLKQLLDTSIECLNALKNLGLPVTQWDAIVGYIIVSKLDPESRKQWEETISGDETDDLPEFTRLKSFLETRFRTLEMVEPANKGSKPMTVKPRTFHAATSNESEIHCAFCKDKHYIFNCKEFLKQSIDERCKYVHDNQLCFNCLMPNHMAFRCRNRSSCKVCRRRHHSILHQDKTQAGEEARLTRDIRESTNNVRENTNNMREITTHLARNNEPGQTVLLATALVEVTSRTGQTHVLRALVDQGSEACFVTARVVELLGLDKISVNGAVSGVGEMHNLIKHVVRLEIKSRCEIQFSTVIEAYVLKTLTRMLPAREVRGYSWPQLDTMELADPTYYKPGRIDILLGADVFSRIIDTGLLRGPGEVIAQYTHLGWILSGGTAQTHDTSSNHIISLHITSNADDNNLLRKFWEIENEAYTTEKILTREEEECEEIYAKTTTRDETGRYVVHLPLKSTVEETVKKCGETKHQAVTRLKQLERRFEKNDKLKQEYKRVIHEYLQLGHMRKAEKEDEMNAIYLPHHAVIREDKDTTKVRVVFDASAKGSYGVSLNDCMMTGPTLQPDLRELLIRWRMHRICAMGDVVKMYRAVKMTEEHVDLHRIVWRDEPEREIESYQLLTVTFGTAAAPYLAVRTLKQLADDEAHDFPEAATVIKNSYFMDDLTTGGDDIPETKRKCKEINTLLRRGGFEMQKWSSNAEEVLDFLREETYNTETVDKIEIKLDDVIKILGLTWNRKEDQFKITINLPEMRHPTTKRVILSDVAKLFDPFGFISPVIITAKVMIQKLWLCSLDWDDELPTELVQEWIEYRGDLQTLQTIEIPRWLKTSSQNKDVQLHGFADASSVAYAAVVYARVRDENDDVHITIIASRTKVAPLKQLTIPKLELCGAVLLAKLLREVAELMKVSMSNIYAWTDSMVVLSWLQSQPSRWQVFVGNRVSEIIQNIDNDRWRHVKSADNPADLASRGVKAEELENAEIWWSGPEWLKHEEEEFKAREVQIPQTEMEAKRVYFVNVEEQPIWERFSSLSRLKRVLAYCKRFKKQTEKNQREKYLAVNEMEEIMQECVKYYQQLIYSEEIEELKKNGKVKKRSTLITLAPFIDKNGVLRVGGRLEKSSCLPESARHPIIIPCKQHITRLIIREAHVRTLHGGIIQMMAFIRTRYWVVRLKSAVREFTRNCNICIKEKARVTQQLMGQIPAPRVTESRCFLNSGVDLAGPIFMRTSKGRGHKSTKGYICLFICLSTKAIHLEAVTDLTSQAFIAAFRRFVARRGNCLHLWSDNATNFVGADKELRDMWDQTKTNVLKDIGECLASEGTTWHFIPPRGPNFGGIWESNIRCVKRHLTKISGETKFTYEEMVTLLCQIEACLNSRPLCHMDETKDTLTPLTPGHFLIGEPLISVPDVNYEERNVNYLTRWQLIQKRVQEFWRRWRSEYLNTLQQRYKWQTATQAPNIGDVVIIKEENLPPASWLLGRVAELHPGYDGLVRVVTVQCKGNSLKKRPLSKLILLSTK